LTSLENRGPGLDEPRDALADSNSVEPADTTAPPQRGRPFVPGRSGNPAGRPEGARNKLIYGINPRAFA
jgi:hypothetical protein